MRRRPSLSPVRHWIGFPKFAAIGEMFSKPAPTTNQPHKLSPLSVREPPGTTRLALLDYNTATPAGGYLKWEGRKCDSHGSPPTKAAISSARQRIAPAKESTQ